MFLVTPLSVRVTLDLSAVEETEVGFLRSKSLVCLTLVKPRLAVVLVVNGDSLDVKQNTSA